MESRIKSIVFTLFPLTLVLFTIKPSRAILNYDDEYFHGAEADRYDWAKHPCKRDCSANEKPRKCEYVFVAEQYSTMSKACYDCPFNVSDCFRPHCIPGNGVQKTIYVVNRQLPGPAIEVCRNDLIFVEVRNRMLSESTVVHWHGIKQYGTPYMDGVAFVNQCPIMPDERFQYLFNASICGTYFWHSHIGSQRSGGFFGQLIIHPFPSENVHRDLYDEDNQRMIITDWMSLENDGLVHEIYYKSEVKPNSMLINGLGRHREFESEDGSTVYTPSAVFTVEQNKTYRFRLVDAGSQDCPIEMSIDNHKLLVISMDSKDVQPVEVDAVTIWPGERIDFVLSANQKIDNYWIRYRGYGLLCQNSSTDGVNQVAILRYIGAPDEDPSGSYGWNIPELSNNTRVLNPYNAGTEISRKVNLTIPLLNATDPNDKSLSEKADQQIYVTFNLNSLDNYDFQRKRLYGYYQVPEIRAVGTFQLNNITLKFTPYPLLSQWDMIKPDTFCNSSSLPKPYCSKEQCVCTHVMQFKLDSVVEMVLVNDGKNGIINHPAHLHGHFFRVVGTENLGENVTVERVKLMDREGKLKRKLDRAPIKDTVRIPGTGYTIIRFIANNPGFWYFHCHYELHRNIGMAFILKVGEYEDFPPVPRNFPKCGDYVPDVM